MITALAPEIRRNMHVIAKEEVEVEQLDQAMILTQALLDLREAGNSIVIIEHNLELVACADWVIDMGPEGGNKGGYVVVEGDPELVANHPKSYTGQFLRPMLAEENYSRLQDCLQHCWDTVLFW